MITGIQFIITKIALLIIINYLLYQGSDTVVYYTTVSDPFSNTVLSSVSIIGTLIF